MYQHEEAQKAFDLAMNALQDAVNAETWETGGTVARVQFLRSDERKTVDELWLAMNNAQAAERLFMEAMTEAGFKVTEDGKIIGVNDEEEKEDKGEESEKENKEDGVRQSKTSGDVYKEPLNNSYPDLPNIQSCINE